MKKIIPVIFIILSIFSGIFFGYQQQMPPSLYHEIDESPISIESAKEEPDLQLMLTHLRNMTSLPHSTGSNALKEVQIYLKTQIETMDYEWIEDSYTLSLDDIRNIQNENFGNREITDKEIQYYAGLGNSTTMDLHNIYVHLQTEKSDENIIFISHTDSTPFGPGTFDDMVSVTSMLEGLRQLKDKELYRNILFLFTDGEELGLLGAYKFIENHPEFVENTIAVVNLEARGNDGGLLLFESSENNLGLIQAYKKGTTSPYATSLSTAVYKLLPNSTDLSLFLKAGYPGINLAVVNGGTSYHTPEDNYENFNRNSAGHYLATVAGLVDYFALTPDLNLNARQDSIHFTFFQGNLIVVPEDVGIAFALFTFLLSILGVFLIIRRKIAHLRTIIISLLWQIAMLVIGGLLTYSAVTIFLGRDFSELYYYLHTDIFYLILLALLTITDSVSGRFLLNKDINPISLVSGNLILLAFLTLITALVVPGASYLFSITTFITILLLFLKLRCKQQAWIFTTVGIFIFIMLFLPINILLHQALNLSGAHLTLPFALLLVITIYNQLVLCLSKESEDKYIINDG